MSRKRKHSVELPSHVHRVMAKGNIYFFYQANRGTARQGPRLALPRDSKSVEFWDAVRTVAGTVPGYSGTVASMIDAYLLSPEFADLSESAKRTHNLYLGHCRLKIGKHQPDSIRPVHILALRDQYKDTPMAAQHDR